jgi:molybdopterin-guanine dinucleotide biosynthesis adapter protein
MKRLHIIGRKNHGKTTLVVELVKEFSRLGLEVGTIKHTHHQHELDVLGKDSYRHRTAGAAAVGILSPAMNAIFIPADGEVGKDRYAIFAPLFAHCDLVLVEGDSTTVAPKLEVWRKEAGGKPIALSDASVLAVVTDGNLPPGVKTCRRSDIGEVADFIFAACQIERTSDRSRLLQTSGTSCAGRHPNEFAPVDACS